MRRRGERVLGPYPHGRRWRVVVADSGDGTRRPRSFATLAAAERYKAAYERDLERAPEESSIDSAIDDYEKHLIAKGNKPKSYKETVRRLRVFFPDQDIDVAELTPPTCERLYRALVDAGMSTDTHRNMLAEARSFLRWCEDKKWCSRNPLDRVQGVGRRKHGKPQLRRDEARLWLATALEKAKKEPGAIAALMTLLLAMRTSEIVGLVVRDVDDSGRLLWISDSKTEAGRRTLEVPEMLVPLLAKLKGDRPGEDLLFGDHWRDWPRKWVQTICDDAKVPVITAHGMRGTFATLAADAGSATHIVAASLGHESYSTTATSYADRQVSDKARRRKALTVLDGGKQPDPKERKARRAGGRSGSRAGA